jgi:hypothetical protein
MAQPGMDLRNWLSYGTVATMDSAGEVDYENPHAIHQGPEGVEVDVYLESLNKLVTCRYAGLQGGPAVYVGAPIHPGDLVVVGMPEGDNAGCVILAIVNSAAQPVPLGDDKKPIFQNDRLLVWSKTVPIDIRIEGGPKVLIEQTGNVTVEAKNVTMKADATMLGASGLTAPVNAVVLGGGIDPYTGVSYYALGNASLSVTAKK